MAAKLSLVGDPSHSGGDVAEILDHSDTAGTDQSVTAPAKWFHFILADEWDPTRQKLTLGRLQLLVAYGRVP
jgi:hypothetical protein